MVGVVRASNLDVDIAEVSKLFNSHEKKVIAAVSKVIDDTK